MAIKKETAINVNQILFCTDPQVSVGAVVANTGVVAVDGKKIIKAGTPLAGDLTARSTAFTVTTTAPVGVALHDIDVTDGDANGTVLAFGFVNLERLDSTTATLITNDIKTALAGKVTFLK